LNGEKLHFRRGKRIYAPKWFTEKFPAQPMGGELWMGRVTFAHISRIVRKKIPDERDWKQVRYMLFELPESSGTFTERIQKMVKLTVSVNIPWLNAILQIHLYSEKALMKMLYEIVKKGGEGA
jgi:DNA ligase-1